MTETMLNVMVDTSGQGRMGGGNRGMMNGFGFNDNDENRRGNFAGTAGFEPGLLHEKMITAMADKLGYTVDELNQQFTDGKSLLDIAAEKNMTVAELIQMQTDVKTQVIDQALKDKLITQAQADFMKQNAGTWALVWVCMVSGLAVRDFQQDKQGNQRIHNRLWHQQFNPLSSKSFLLFYIPDNSSGMIHLKIHGLFTAN